MLGKDKRTIETEDAGLGPGGSSGSVNLISSGTVIEGQIHCKGDIRVDGKVLGKISSKSKIVVGTTGEVDGDISCQHADVFGKYQGNMQVREILFMKSGCNVNGDVQTGKLVVEAGANFSGHCNMGEPPAADPLPRNGKDHEAGREPGKKVEVPA